MEQTSSTPNCLVCNESHAEVPFVGCVQCHSPHHKDCWAFTGRCATFGCGSQDYKLLGSIDKVAGFANAPQQEAAARAQAIHRKTQVMSVLFGGLLVAIGFQAWQGSKPGAKWSWPPVRRTTDGDRTSDVWRRLGNSAQERDAIAQVHLARHYEEGDGLRAAPDQAAYWYWQAADQDSRSAKSRLGRLCWEGLGVPQNKALATEFVKFAAEAGDSTAQANLGAMKLAASDEVGAKPWLERAAQAGNPAAAYNLALLGLRATPQDPSAQRWLKMAARSLSEAQAILATQPQSSQ